MALASCSRPTAGMTSRCQVMPACSSSLPDAVPGRCSRLPMVLQPVASRGRVACAAGPMQQMPPPPQRPTPPGRMEPGPSGPQGSYGMPPPPQQQGSPYTQPGYYPPPFPPGGPQQPPQDKKLGSYATALVAAAFIAGLGIGVYFDSEVTLTPANVSSTEIIDRSTPNADLCMANGYSASVFDMKLYVTFNPFNVYTTQPVIKSGCVLRRANVGLLEREKLVTPHEVELCKSRMNTFAYMGDLKDNPEVACVYHSEEAENQYLDDLRRKGLGGVNVSKPGAAADAVAAAAAAASR